MLTIAITGRSGSGKSVVASHYAALGYPIVDGDKVAREITGLGKPALAELVQVFGTDILAADGTLRRHKLADIAFSASENNEKLIAITHPHITKELLRQRDIAKAQGVKLFFVDGAMIVGQEFEPYCDKIIVVISEPRVSLSRVILRDGISKTAATTRLSAQLSVEELTKSADFVIDNNADLDSLHRKADKVLHTLLQLV